MKKESNFFYKYYTINQNFLSSIVNNELYFSDPRNFNDPFDSFPRINLIDDYEKLRTFYLFMSEKINLKQKEIEEFKNFEDKQREIFTFYNNINIFEQACEINMPHIQSKMYLDFIFLSIDIDKYGVVCGSESSTCPVMWGHYGNNHKGICLKIQFMDDEKNSICLNNEENVEIINVDYSDNPLKIFDYDKIELDNLITKIFQSKSQKLDYEKEVRLIKKKQGLIKIKKEFITEIVFGCRSSPKDRYTICKLFASLGYNLKDINIAKMQPDNYEMKIQGMQLLDIAGSGTFIEELNIEPPFLK